ncbi:MAG: hypothetical protein ACTS43_01460 [Candidatus Hodgkinia cicadicola]
MAGGWAFNNIIGNIATAHVTKLWGESVKDFILIIKRSIRETFESLKAKELVRCGGKERKPREGGKVKQR